MSGPTAERIFGLLLGTAVGDAVGLPREGLSARRAVRLFGPPPFRHQLLFGRGLVSDDTEHAVMTAEALCRAPIDSRRFARALAWKLRGWLAALPAGVGLATLRSILKLWIGVSADRSGINSAGNGPAMRSPVLGAGLGCDPGRLRDFVRASTRLTHTDERAFEGAWAIAVATAAGSTEREIGALRAEEVLAALRAACGDAELRRLFDAIERGLAAGVSPADFAASIGAKGAVSGYMYQTVPVALYCWLRHATDFRDAVESVIALGGDTDTTAAIVGALAGATLGPSAIPADWVRGLVGPPSVPALRRLASAVAAVCEDRPVASPFDPLSWPRQALKNAVLLVVVLVHGLRRGLPPY